MLRWQQTRTTPDTSDYAVKLLRCAVILAVGHPFVYPHLVSLASRGDGDHDCSFIGWAAATAAKACCVPVYRSTVGSLLWPRVVHSTGLKTCMRQRALPPRPSLRPSWKLHSSVSQPVPLLPPRLRRSETWLRLECAFNSWSAWCTTSNDSAGPSLQRRSVGSPHRRWFTFENGSATILTPRIRSLPISSARSPSPGWRFWS